MCIHKVPATIKSRCQQFSFKRISPLGIAGRLKYVAGEEGIPLTNEGADLLARLADGGMRDALSLLDQCAGGEGAELGEQEILDALGLAGNVETAGLMTEVINRDTGSALERIGRLYAAGKDVGSLVSELASLTRDLLIRKTAPRGGAGLLTGGYDEGTLRGLSESLTVPRLAQMLGQLQTTAADLGRSANRRVDAELCVIRLCDESLDESTAGLTARLAKLEEHITNGPTAVPVMAQAVQVQPRQQPPVKEPVKPSPKADDVPPWEETSPPEELPPQEEVPPPTKEPMPEPINEVGLEPTHSSAPPEEKKQEPADRPTPAPVGDFWPGFARSLKGKIPMGEYSFLSNPVMAQGRAEGMDLILWVQSDFIKTMIDKPGVLSLVNQEVRSLMGGPGRTVVRVGEAPKVESRAEGPDPLDDLLSGEFGDIITEE